jgi:hypothetical protein
MKQWIALVLILTLSSSFTSGFQASDADGDGLSADQEALLQTDPNNADSDGDGLDDGTEYFVRFTNPALADSDEDGINDNLDPFPTWLNYVDLGGVTTQTDRVMDSAEGRTLNQLVEVAVGNVITIDWFNQLSPEFDLASADFTISFDFIDPNREDFSDDGFYRVAEDGQTALVRIPGTVELVEETTDWRDTSMTISDWPYHFYNKPIEVGQTWDFNVFYHEFLPQDEAPYFVGHAEVLRTETFPLNTKLGRRDVEVFVVEATLTHDTFNDPFFRAFLGDTPTLRTLVYFTTDHQVIVRFTTPFFRITPSKQVGFSDFIVNH